MNGLSLAFAPMLPWPILALGGIVALLLLAFGVWRRARGVGWRFLAFAVLFLLLADPSVIQEKREPQRDVALVVVDQSASQKIGARRRVAEETAAHLVDTLKAFPDLDVRLVRAGDAAMTATGGDHGTELFGPLGQALSDVPKQRVAGIAMITDGEVHDVPAKLGFDAPLHVLLTGKRDEADRRLVIVQAPSFGLVGKEAQLVLRVEDLPVGGGPAPRSTSNGGGQARITLRKDGGQPLTRTVTVGRDTPLPLTIDHGGQNIFEIEVERGPRELTLDNNRAAIVVNGVRDRLKVLLVTGEPYQGERTWRNLLKADPSVDLVHFTILRPPEKQDGTPIRELSLIAFPIRELFDVKIDEFDLIIFDRYRQRAVLPQTYFQNIADYVRKGGALLEAAGPTFGTPLSLYRTPLGTVLPAEPNGDTLERGFKPQVNAVGLRHPVTEGLPGLSADASQDPSWGRWFRLVQADVRRGTTVMTGADAKPLLVLDRVGQGRVAQLLSDEAWLWTRGFESGGPQAELLRRLAYWLMKEPDLEENDLRGTVEGDRLTITRQSLQPSDKPVKVTGPDGETRSVTLGPAGGSAGGGRSTATSPVTEAGLYRITDCDRSTIAAAGALNPVELSDVRTTERLVEPVVKASGGSLTWPDDGDGQPEIRRVAPGRTSEGRGWIGFRTNGDYIVTGATALPLMPAWLALLLGLGTLLLGWRREGR